MLKVEKWIFVGIGEKKSPYWIWMVATYEKAIPTGVSFSGKLKKYILISETWKYYSP